MPGTSVQISTRSRAEQRTEVAGRGVRSAATEQHRVAAGLARDEALGDEQLAALGQIGADRLARARIAHRAQVARPLGLQRLLAAGQVVARIQPLHRHAQTGEEVRSERARPEFALRQQFGLPGKAAGGGAHIGHQTAQRVDARIQQLRRQVQIAGKGQMAFDQRLGGRGHRRGIAVQRRHRLERIGDARQGRHHGDDLEALLLAGPHQSTDVLPSVPARHTGAAKLEYDPAHGGCGVLSQHPVTLRF